MKWLLDIATSETNFLFNGLRPLMADIFMIELETTLMKELTKLGVLYWRRFVDDIFVLTRPDSDISSFQLALNKFHYNIKFTCEAEKDNNTGRNILCWSNYIEIWKTTC
jgi:hypothetical protein